MHESPPDDAIGGAVLAADMLRVEARKLLLEESARRATRHGLAAAELAKRRLGDPLRVADLAEAACMSEQAFDRAFQNEFGQTPLAYLTALRMKRAERLLRNPRRSVADVAATVGFASVSHFIRIFRGHAGRTPKQYQLVRQRIVA